jgi:hypothetical protein
MLARLTALIVALSAVSPLPAQATASEGTPESLREAEAFSTRAKELFRGKRFIPAAKLFMQAYALSHEPAQVYNAARAYEEAGMASEAAALFRVYISLTDDADGIAEARERIRRLEATQPAEATPPVEADAPTVIPDIAPLLPSEDPVWPKWAATGGAAASLGAGVALLLIGSAGTEDANSRLSHDPTAYTDAYSAARTQWWAGAGLAGLGVGLTGLATWLWFADSWQLTDSRQPRDSPDAQATVMVAPAAGGLCVVGHF